MDIITLFWHTNKVRYSRSCETLGWLHEFSNELRALLTHWWYIPWFEDFLLLECQNVFQSVELLINKVNEVQLKICNFDEIYFTKTSSEQHAFIIDFTWFQSNTFLFFRIWILNSCLTNLTVRIKSSLLFRKNLIKIIIET